MLDGQATLSGGKLAVYAIAAIGVLAFSIFRLDEVIARRKRGQRPRLKRPMGHNPEGEPRFTDPDGRAWPDRK